MQVWEWNWSCSGFINFNPDPIPLNSILIGNFGWWVKSVFCKKWSDLIFITILIGWAIWGWIYLCVNLFAAWPNGSHVNLYLLNVSFLYDRHHCTRRHKRVSTVRFIPSRVNTADWSTMSHHLNHSHVICFNLKIIVLNRNKIETSGPVKFVELRIQVFRFVIYSDRYLFRDLYISRTGVFVVLKMGRVKCKHHIRIYLMLKGYEKQQ